MPRYYYDEECSPVENIAMALFAIASELSALGNGSCSDPNGHGAIENLAMIMRDGLKEVADSMGYISNSITDGITCRITTRD
ncbi:MAG: hypothetical protein ACLGSA_04800 [Acidobacteriota bacterium]